MEENLQHNQDRRLRPPEAGQNNHHQPPPLEKCPRCDSDNTKFCYYNNYSLSQPRYFCKSCRRYWTHGGTLRNVPIGGGCRKSKRPKISGLASPTKVARTQVLPSPAHPGHSLMPDPESTMCSNTFYGGETLLSSLATLQAINQPLFAAATCNSGGGFGANMDLLQGMNNSSLTPQQAAPQQFDSEFFPSQHGSMSSLNQVFVNRDSATTSAMVRGNLWSGTAAEEGEHHACSSFNPNQSSEVDHPSL